MQYFTEHQLARLIMRPPGVLRAWRVCGGGPAFIKPKGRVLYSFDALEAWTEDRDNALYVAEQAERAGLGGGLGQAERETEWTRRRAERLGEAPRCQR